MIVTIITIAATFVIVDPSKLYFKSEIDQEVVNKIKVGQAVTLNLDSFPDQELNSKITYIAFTPVSGQTSTVYEIRFELPVSNQPLPPRRLEFAAGVIPLNVRLAGAILGSLKILGSVVSVPAFVKVFHRSSCAFPTFAMKQVKKRRDKNFVRL